MEPSVIKSAYEPLDDSSTLKSSIIIPTYERPDDLSDLLNSLLRQTTKPTEVIIVDDTPTDAIIRVFEDREVRFQEARIVLSYIKNRQKPSLTVARNLGSRKAQGDIVFFMDSDLVLYPDYVRNVLDTYNKHPEALGVAGWIVSLDPLPGGIRYYTIETLKKLFLLFHDSKNSCKYAEYPTSLSKTTNNCQRLSGSTMTFKRCVFSEFRFDENLKGYAFMEDVLFSVSIHQKYPNRLFMTPNAKCIHKASREGRVESSQLRLAKLQYRKYVLTKLFGIRGLLMFGWQNLGLLIFRLGARTRKWEFAPIEQ